MEQSMHKRLVIFLSVLVLPFATLADNSDSTYTGLRGQRLNLLSKELALTSKQKAELEQVLNDQAEELREIYEDSHKQIMEVLSADQRAKWETLSAQRKQNRLQRLEEEQKQ
jgi:Spy/CpxP family protein refolding chaperone